MLSSRLGGISSTRFHTGTMMISFFSLCTYISRLFTLQSCQDSFQKYCSKSYMYVYFYISIIHYLMINRISMVFWWSLMMPHIQERIRQMYFTHKFRIVYINWLWYSSKYILFYSSMLSPLLAIPNKTTKKIKVTTVPYIVIL